MHRCYCVLPACTFRGGARGARGARELGELWEKLVVVFDRSSPLPWKAYCVSGCRVVGPDCRPRTWGACVPLPPPKGQTRSGQDAGGVGSYDQELGCWKRPVYTVHTYLATRQVCAYFYTLAVNSSHLPTTATPANPALGMGIA